MKFGMTVLGLLSLVSVAHAACPDVSGRFKGWCTESTGRSARYVFELKQNGCDSVKMVVPFGDLIKISEELGEPVYDPEGGYVRTKGSYSETTLTTDILVVSARGERYLEKTKFTKVQVDGHDALDFDQRLSGSVSAHVTCRLPSVN